jgi:glycosyltransferase involved in cell wall biosynthesis
MVSRLAPPDYSGAGTQAARLSRELATLGIQVRMLATTSHRWRPAKGELPGGIPIARWPAPNQPSRIQKAMFLGGLAAHLLAHPRRYDVVHVHGAIYVLRLLRALKPLLGFRVIYKATMCGMDDARSVARWGGHKVVDSVDRWACIATPIADATRSVGVPDSRIAPISNAVDITRFRPLPPDERRAMRESLGVADGRRLIVTVGAVIARKRQRLLVQALGRMPEPRPLLIVAGPLHYDEAYVAALRSDVETLGLQDAVRILGPRDDIPGLLAAGDTFAFASHHEGSPNAVLEALAVGLPVVSTTFESIVDVERLAPERVAVVAEDPDAVALALADAPSPGTVPPGMTDLSLETIALRYQRVYLELLADA